MKKLSIVIFMAVPVAAIADVAPMSRDEWEHCRQFASPISIDDMSSTDAGCAGCMLAGLIGVCLSVCVFAMTKERLQRGNAWRKAMKLVILTALILTGCLWAEFLFCPCSMFLSMVNGRCTEPNKPSHPRDETYEEYLFYKRHCRKCGTALEYDCGRYCPKCHPRPVAIGL